MVSQIHFQHARPASNLSDELAVFSTDLQQISRCLRCNSTDSQQARRHSFAALIGSDNPVSATSTLVAFLVELDACITSCRATPLAAATACEASYIDSIMAQLAHKRLVSFASSHCSLL